MQTLNYISRLDVRHNRFAIEHMNLGQAAGSRNCAPVSVDKSHRRATSNGIDHPTTDVFAERPPPTQLSYDLNSNTYSFEFVKTIFKCTPRDSFET